MANSKLTLFADLLMGVDQVCLWQFDAQMGLVQTSCPDYQILLDMFRIDRCAEQILQYFKENRDPVVLSDSLGLLWLADYMQATDESAKEYYVIGPILTSNLQDQNFTRKMEYAQLSSQLQRETLSQINAIPIISLDLLLRYGSMLHHCITGTRVEPSAIRLNPNIQPSMHSAMRSMADIGVHGTWHYEQYLLKLIRNGDLSYAKKLETMFVGGRSGLMCPGNPLRQVKDESIVLIALATRAAIEGGLIPDTAYTLSDYHIQMTEAAQTVNAVYAIMSGALEDFVTRVHMLKKMDGISQLSLGCMDYVDRHISEKIQIKNIASSLGYADYYLTSKFKKDTGINLRDYICQKKVEHAKLLLNGTQLSVQQISEQLNFSSVSYFCVVFQKFAGMTPGDFRTQTSK